MFAWRVSFGEFHGSSGSGYTLDMDSVRFGRALGFGARAAAKTLMTAVDAATSPNPSGAKAKPSAEASAPAAAAAGTSASTVESKKISGARLAQQTARATTQARQTGRGLKEGGRRFQKEVGGRLVTLSRVLWLEVTGVFFGIFAVFAGGGAWKMRAAAHETAGNHEAHVQFLMAAAMALIFGYFCVSSFVRASRRGRRS
jgi:hypothetical protein